MDKISSRTQGPTGTTTNRGNNMSIRNKLFQSLAAGAVLAMCSFGASANLLVNPGFELDPFGGAEQPGAGTGWSTFGAPFRVQQPGPGPTDPISSAGAHGGTVALKIFGLAGAFQDFTAAPGDSFDGSVWAINPNNADVLAGGQVGAVNIEWLDSGGGLIDFAAGDQITSSTPQDVWTLLSVSGTAPAGTATARFVIITGDFAGPGGGAGRYDDASFDVAAIPVPAAVWLFGSGLVGLVGVARRRKS